MNQAVPRTRHLLAIAGLAAAAATAACGSGRGPSAAAAPPPGGGAAPASVGETARSGLRPGDALLLKVYREPDLSDTIQVDEDGRAVFPLLGPRVVTEIPADTLKRQLVADYRQYVKSPAIEVKVLRRISVLGEVKKPGLYPVDPTITLTDALALAGGPTPAADRSDIQLLRDGKIVRKSLEETRAIAYTPIRSGDQIVVGRKSWISRNWQWLAGTVVSASVLLLTR